MTHGTWTRDRRPGLRRAVPLLRPADIGVVLTDDGPIVIDTREHGRPGARDPGRPSCPDAPPSRGGRQHPPPLRPRLRQRRLPAGADLGSRALRRVPPRATPEAYRLEVAREELPQLAEDVLATEIDPPDRTFGDDGADLDDRRAPARAALPRPRAHRRRHRDRRAGCGRPVRRRSRRERRPAVLRRRLPARLAGHAPGHPAARGRRGRPGPWRRRATSPSSIGRSPRSRRSPTCRGGSPPASSPSRRRSPRRPTRRDDRARGDRAGGRSGARRARRRAEPRSRLPCRRPPSVPPAR